MEKKMTYTITAAANAISRNALTEQGELFIADEATGLTPIETAIRAAHAFYAKLADNYIISKLDMNYTVQKADDGFIYISLVFTKPADLDEVISGAELNREIEELFMNNLMGELISQYDFYEQWDLFAPFIKISATVGETIAAS
jgi:hypothetical protein